MKFMQRAAASSSPNSSSPTTQDEPSAKRRKVTDDSPSKFNVHDLVDQRAIQKALANEEAKRQAAIEKQATELGDTRWVLNFEDGRNTSTLPKNTLRIVQAGFANLDNLPLHLKSADSEGKSEDRPSEVGRKSFGRFNRSLETGQSSDLSQSSESSSEDSESSESEGDSNKIEKEGPADVDELIKASHLEASRRAKAERKAKRKAQRAESLELAKKRKMKEVKLNGISQTSLTGRQDKVDSRTCHKCGVAGHIQRDCPKSKRAFQGDDDGPPRKTRKER